MNNKLTVFIEIDGTSIYVGDIIEDTPASASFTYSPNTCQIRKTVPFL